MPRAILFVFALFVIEILVLIKVGSYLGAITTVSLMFAMMIVGIFLIRIRLKALLAAFHHEPNISTSLIWLPLAGVLFIFPGFVSDFLGLLLLIPVVQQFLANKFFIKSKVFSNFTFYGDFTAGSKKDDGDVIDGEFTEIKEDNSLLGKPENKDFSKKP